MRRLWVWLAVAAGWTALALFFTVSASLTYRSTGRAANWTLSLERSLVEWWLWRCSRRSSSGWRGDFRSTIAGREARWHCT